ncbi:hypothetical protein JXVLWARM_CDS_0111 [Burkholderia phage Bm1]
MSNGLEVTMMEVRREMRSAGIPDSRSAEAHAKAMFDAGIAFAGRHFATQIVALQNKIDSMDPGNVSAGIDALVRQIDVAINGEKGAAKQASLVDVASQIKKIAGNSTIVDLVSESSHFGPDVNRRQIVEAVIELRNRYGVPFEFPMPDSGQVVSGLMYPEHPLVKGAVDILEALIAEV